MKRPLLSIFNSEKKKIQDLARRLGTNVPDAMSLVAWPLPILEEVANRLEIIDKRLEVLEKAAGELPSLGT